MSAEVLTHAPILAASPQRVHAQLEKFGNAVIEDSKV